MDSSSEEKSVRDKSKIRDWKVMQQNVRCIFSFLIFQKIFFCGVFLSHNF